MNKRIQTYDDLLEEKERLQALLKTQREAVSQDFHAMGEVLAPVKSAISVAGKLFSRDNSNLLLTASANTLIDVVIKNLFLSRAGWLTRLIVPFFLKNYSSHIKGGAVLKKLFSWIGKKHASGKEHANGQEKVHDDIDLDEN